MNTVRLANAIGIFITAWSTGIDAGNITSCHLTGGRAFSPTVQHGLKIHGNRNITSISLPDKIGCFRVYIKNQIHRVVTYSLSHIDCSRFASWRSSAAGSSSRGSLEASWSVCPMGRSTFAATYSELEGRWVVCPSSKPLIYFSTYRFIAAMSSNILSRRDAVSISFSGCFSRNRVLTIC